MTALGVLALKVEQAPRRLVAIEIGRHRLGWPLIAGELAKQCLNPGDRAAVTVGSVRTMIQCDNCGQEFEPVRTHWVCPYC